MGAPVATRPELILGFLAILLRAIRTDRIVSNPLNGPWKGKGDLPYRSMGFCRVGVRLPVQPLRGGRARMPACLPTSPDHAPHVAGAAWHQRCSLMAAGRWVATTVSYALATITAPRRPPLRGRVRGRLPPCRTPLSHSPHAADERGGAPRAEAHGIVVQCVERVVARTPSSPGQRGVYSALVSAVRPSPSRSRPNRLARRAAIRPSAGLWPQGDDECGRSRP